VAEGRPDLVLEGGAVDGGGGFGFWVCGGGAGLKYESWENAVEGGGVVEGAGAEGEEVCACFGGGLDVEFEFYGTMGCVELGGVGCDGICFGRDSFDVLLLT
jgi:hypothetical protein